MTAERRRVALITGCGRANGIGRACALALADQGIAVAVSDIADRAAANAHEAAGTVDDGGLSGLVAAIRERGGKAIAVTGDVRTEAETRRMVEETVSALGGIDILVCSAAAPHGADRAEIDDVPIEAWDDVMAINARGPFLLARAALPHMRAQGWGRIVNIASAIVSQPRRLRAVYQASKSALVGLTGGLAVDVADKGITVNAVCPGSVITARAVSTALRSGYADPSDAFRESALSIPMRRHGKPEEIAGMVAFLISDAAAYVTGQTVTIDGGGIPFYRG